ncbi:hypothetical protein L2E82_35277 [Cichorium intybus]|uniref:Uncharacterized protein n=1 Tax=Cichorium intybus TaxID=13427 RepID=A0ACB9BNH5_CICIN|nr:hypothetical protein L2E82_35277 [Cichorium intybus]
MEDKEEGEFSSDNESITTGSSSEVNSDFVDEESDWKPMADESIPDFSVVADTHDHQVKVVEEVSGSYGKQNFSTPMENTTEKVATNVGLCVDPDPNSENSSSAPILDCSVSPFRPNQNEDRNPIQLLA